MPPRKPVEDVEPDSPVGATADAPSDLSDEEATQALLLKQEKRLSDQEAMIARLAAQVEVMSQTAESNIGPNEDLPDPEDFLPAPPPEGSKRYASRFSDLTMVWQERIDKVIDGIPMKVPVIRGTADFTGGVYETDDPEKQAWLDSHDRLNVDFWEDMYAVKRYTRVQVTTGVKSTQQAVPAQPPRQPLSAPMN